MIKIKFTPETLKLEVTGHAKHGKKGEDIVCAAISTLFYTLGEVLHSSLDMLEGEPEFKDSKGKGIISCTPKEEYNANIVLSYRAILIGMELVANNYPKNVTFNVVGR